MSAQRGFSYLAVLFLVALTAAALAALGQAWSTAAQRERERELMFRGGEIARAIAAYAAATPTPPQQHPRRLEDLLDDRRGAKPRHHLRRLYADPFTQEPDWVLVPDPSQPGAFLGVRSRSTQRLLRERGLDGSPVRVAGDLVFTARDYANRPQPSDVPAAAASAASAAGANADAQP
jgi:type II secretory pathway pseudopilin PulG